MSILAAIGGFISAAVAVIGPALSSAATFIATKLPTILQTASVIVSAISTIVTSVSNMLGIAPEDEKPDELGAKTMQEGTRPIKEGETTQEYLDYLRNEVPLDREKYEMMTPEQKLNCEIIGDTMLAKSIEEKTGVEIPPEFLIAAGRVNLGYQTAKALIDKVSNSEMDSLDDYAKYISNDMSEKDAVKVGDVVREAISEANPEMSPEDIEAEVIAMKQEYNKEDSEFVNEEIL